MALRSGAQHFHLDARVNVELAYQAIPFAQEKVAHIERHGDAVLNVQGFLTVSFVIVVFDVIMNQRGFVETLDSQGEFPEVVL